MTSMLTLILGGYGNAGLAIARLRVSQKSVGIILAGRNGERAPFAATQLNTTFNTWRIL
jgi:predicted dinucleotide-binding enzyme